MAATVRVWDPLVRLFHWSLVATVAMAWLSGDEWEALHIWAGYAAAALVAFRLVWGVLGTRYARFGQFVRSPSAVATYLREVLAGREPRYLGHNPAGGAMILALISTLAALGLSGWAMTTDAFWSVEWVEEIHEFLANLLLVLIALHIGGVILAGLRHKENLVRAMFTGRKRAGEAADAT